MPTLRAATGIRPRAAMFLALLSLSAAPIASPARAQSTTQHSDPQPTGSARITGRVLAVDNGAPVRRAHVRLSGVPGETQNAAPKRPYLQKEVETDDVRRCCSPSTRQRSSRRSGAGYGGSGAAAILRVSRPTKIVTQETPIAGQEKGRRKPQCCVRVREPRVQGWTHQVDEREDGVIRRKRVRVEPERAATALTLRLSTTR